MFDIYFMMKKYIFLSEKIRNQVNLPERYSEKIIFSKNISFDIKNLINSDRKKNNKSILTVIFIHIDEFKKVNAFLAGKYNYSEISYKIIVLGNEFDLKKIDKKKLNHISDIKLSNISSLEFDILVKKAFLQIEGFYRYKMQMELDIIKLEDMKQDQDDLINIGKSLSTEKNPDELIKKILLISKKITGADAGSIYITEESKAGKKHLRFKYSHTFSKNLPFEEFTLSINKNSIAGYVATTGEVLNIPDAYNIHNNAPFSFDISFDKQNNYKCRSMLVVPMRNHIDQIIGVIQLINSKESINGEKKRTGNEAFEVYLKTQKDFKELVISFDSRYESLMESVAGQAAIAIENNRMIEQIQNQFEEFVKASVNAVESRDIATSGHSFRVAKICKEMANAINNIKNGPYKNISFSDTEIKELEFAALLHDFGKVYIDINIFKKEKKLYKNEFDNLILRLNYLYKFIELSYANKENKLIRSRGKTATSKQIELVNAKKNKKLNTIIKIKERITSLNEPTIRGKNPKSIIAEIQKELRGIDFFDIEGDRISLITKNEKQNLEIQKGSLNKIERKEIENHVIHTYNFVSTIPWPPEFKNIPEIVLHHHEMPDGSGYPRGIKGVDKIPIQARIISIADIYDALIATDRPYKKAIKHETALKILDEEAKNRKLDKNLLNIFIKKKIYNIIDKNALKKKDIVHEKTIH